ncbi:MAG: hypothetical protein GY754_07515, partial [bacterium]|nr:hypothetical protein [bacterium]
DKDVQTVSIYPWESYSAIAEKFTFLGATRIVETGMAGHPRGGFSHDGMHPMSRMINWVCAERSPQFQYRYFKGDRNKIEEHFFGPRRQRS